MENASSSDSHLVKTWFYEFYGGGKAIHKRPGEIEAHRDIKVDQLVSHIVFKTWKLSTAAFGRQVQLFRSREDIAEVSNALEEGVFCSALRSSKEAPLILKINDEFSLVRRGAIGYFGFYAAADDIWDYSSPAEPWHGSIEKFRRSNTPSVYKDLVVGIIQVPEGAESNFEADVATSAMSSIKVLNKALYSILGHGDEEKNSKCNKAHLIPKAATCRQFYGPVAEIATGMYGNPTFTDLASRKIKMWKGLLWGGKQFSSLERRVENFLMMTSPHGPIFDILSDGQVVVVPICGTEFCRTWEQGKHYDLLVLANKVRTVSPPSDRTTATFHREALPEEIDRATTFLGDCIKALAEMLSDEKVLFDPIGDYLQETNDVACCEDKYRVAKRAKLQELIELRDTLVEGVTVPRVKSNCDKVVLKIDMKAYLKISEIGFLKSNLQPYPDPWLLGVKAAINSYFLWKRKKLLPACDPQNEDDESSFSDPLTHASFPSAFRKIFREMAHRPVPDEVACASDKDDDISLVSTDDVVDSIQGIYDDDCVSVAASPTTSRARNVTP